MLTTDAAVELYHRYAAKMPIIDYHCHLDPKMIARNHRFSGITEAWLGGDHYKWRAMRANGVSEEYITGSRSDYEKFGKWAETVPYTMRNPLYHWTHLELARLFGIDRVLSPATAREIYDACNAALATDAFTAQALMRRCNVRAVCTTDDPIDSLEYHRELAAGDFAVRVLPTWRPDRALAVADAADYNGYLARLEEASDVSIGSYAQLLDALRRRHDCFAAAGCRLSDHGMDTFPTDDYTENDLRRIFDKVRGGSTLHPQEVAQLQGGLLFELAVMDSEKGWTQQFHIGPIRNPNTRMFRRLGPDTGYDMIAVTDCSATISSLLSALTKEDACPKVILYSLNPADFDMLGTILGAFQDDEIPGKIQLGSAWWFCDTDDGMYQQMKTLARLGLLGNFIGMLTDSRSFLSYTRHELFRRLMCNLIGNWVENGQYPNDEKSLKKIVEGISYYNAKRYFNL